ncbi:hypothetical protein GH714_042095 [Hevea brasiliensis]|uniref:Pentacotripeptide-repeat region of PRORP domain-containing protein n=1 Tax=Hevea brasiliensis TaxID=3981 RepID=A0A6A6MUA5_HEVBR|nr:hypothetical protein GH714_042095 [Hevea brasiliensis]
MTRSRFLYLLSGIPLCAENCLIRSLASSQECIKKQFFTFNSTTNYENPSTPLSSFHRSIHANLEQSQVLIRDDDQNPEILIYKTIEDTEKICRLLSKNPISSIESLLDNASIEVSPALVLEVLKRLSNAGVLALSFFRWAEKQKGFMYSTESYNALIESLGKIKQFNMMWNLVSDMKRKRLLTKETFALISRRYARARRVKEAIDTFEKMEKFGLKIESSDFNRLIDTLSKSRQVQSAQDVFDKMKNRRFVPDIKSYTILLEGWGQEKNLLKLDEVYREMKDDGFEPDVITYGILINAYCKAKKYDIAIDLFNKMEAKNCPPNPHIFCTLINGLGSEKRLSEALEFFELSKARGFVPEAPTYNAVVGAYCWSMRMDDTYRMVDDEKMWDCEEGCEPTVSTYEIIVRMFCNMDRVDRAINIWDQMKAKGILPGMHMFSTLINSLCHENKLDMACKYFEEMLDVGIRPSAALFSNLKQALLDKGKKDTAVLLAKKIDKLRKTPFVV